MNWWKVSVFGIIPVLSVIIIFFVRKKFLWFAPAISTVLSVVISMIAMPSIITYSEHRAMFFGIVIPIQLVVVIILALIAYFVTRILNQK